jgi:CheY-like chemotaxis protein
MESVGRLAGGVAHDFNNMLGVILGYTEMALNSLAPEDKIHSHLSQVREAAERSAGLTRQLLAFARKQTVSPRVIDLNETVEGMLKMLRRIIGENIKLLWKPGEGPCPVMVDPSQIDQLLANLCVNAKDSINGVGQLIIETGGRTLDKDFCAVRPGFHPGRYVLLTVRDNGCGMESETLDHIFEPFFTTKELGKGTGLGLATVYGMVKQNKGFIDVVSTPGLGTTFTVYLPRHDAKQEQPDQDLPAASTPEGRETILLVEDEPVILEMTSQMLKDFGYTVLKASSPGEAIRLAREYSGSIHLLLTDVVMPEMNGRNLARILLSLYPEMKRLFMSGYTADVIAHHGVLNEGVAFIQKPFSIQDLGNRIRGVLEGED